MHEHHRHVMIQLSALADDVLAENQLASELRARLRSWWGAVDAMPIDGDRTLNEGLLKALDRAITGLEKGLPLTAFAANRDALAEMNAEAVRRLQAR